MRPIEGMGFFRWRLAETIAWCAQHASATDPIHSLRTSALRPALFDTIELLTEELPGGRLAETAAQVQPIVELLAQERARRIQQNGSYPHAWAEDLARGRLPLYDPCDNLADGAATEASAGFFSNNNVPAWDTWVCFVYDRTVDMKRLARSYDTRDDYQGESHIGPRHAESFRACLISWIPPLLVPLVTAGINVNPELCIAWAEDLDIPLTRQLRHAGLLPTDLEWAYYETAQDTEQEVEALDWIEGTIGDAV